MEIETDIDTCSSTTCSTHVQNIHNCETDFYTSTFGAHFYRMVTIPFGVALKQLKVTEIWLFLIPKCPSTFNIYPNNFPKQFI